MNDQATANPAAMSDAEAQYMRGVGREPAKPSVLVSNSKFLSDPYYRDTWAQFSLRRVGNDVAETYLIPNMSKALAAVTDVAEFIQLIEAEKVKYPLFGEWLAAKRLKIYKPDELEGHADGTLGAEIRTFLLESGMDIDFIMKNEAPKSDFDYLLKRRGASHDIEHMVTGFGPVHAGEVALGFANVTSTARFFTPELAHYLSSATMFTSTAGLYRDSLHYPATLPTMLEAVRMGIQAGESVNKPLFMVDWEDYLDWPLAEIAAHLNIKRGPATAWDWTKDACKDG
jgi:ubiquinone biosynthesis protein COQ4